MSYSARTRVLTLDRRQPDRAALTEAIWVLRAGGLVAFPTETVYGLGANALDPAAVDRIYAAKGRPTSDPIIVHIGAMARVDQVAVDIQPLAARLAEKFWPGPLTLVLKRAALVPSNVSAGGDTVGVRMPNHPVALALLRAAGMPIAAPSANLYGRPSPTTAQHVLDDLDGHVDLILDAGATDVGVESTVLDMTTSPPRVLRPGGVSVEALRLVAPDIDVVARYLRDDETAPAPGMMLRHYSPRARMVLYQGAPERALAAQLAEARALADQGQRVGVLAYVGDELPSGLGVEVETVGPASDPEMVARRLFAGLRALDARGVDVILARTLPRTGLGLAIWDRLVRAAEGHVVDVGGE